MLVRWFWLLGLSVCASFLRLFLLVSLLYSFGCCTCCSGCLFANGFLFCICLGLVVGCLVVCVFIAAFGLFWFALVGVAGCSFCDFDWCWV